MWCKFLNDNKRNNSILRPFIDLDEVLQADVLDLASDAAKGPELGAGAVFGRKWIFVRWEPNYIRICDPSIEYLELLGVCLAVFAWRELLSNKRFIIFCDNMSVVSMINQSSSTCKNCMCLIRLLTLESLKRNMRVFARWVKGLENGRPDALSRQKIDRFKKLSYNMNIVPEAEPTTIPTELWPASRMHSC